MTLLWICVLWVLASAGVAMLPLRAQYIPGVALLAAGPVLIVLIALQSSWVIALLGVVALGSMYRNPLLCLWGRMRGEQAELPK